MGGTIGFVGLVIPHIVRFIVGPDYRLIIPCSAVMGALLLVFADVGARMINPPFETPVGAITAMIGVPFFLYLARREGRGCSDEYNAKNHVRVDDPPLAILAVFLFSLNMGTMKIPLAEVIKAFNGTGSEQNYTVLMHFRLPAWSLPS